MRRPIWCAGMRALPALLAVLLFAGCLGGVPSDTKAVQAIASCRELPAAAYTVYFGPAMRLQNTSAPAGYASGNSFSSAFLDNDLKEWLSDPVTAGLWLTGNVTLEYWVRSTGAPAPVAVNRNEPGRGYHLFSQFGSDRSLQPSTAVEYSDIAPMAGTIDHYTETLAMPPGGFVVEAGDRIRVLLTDLALDGPSGGGHDVLFGGDTPSQVRFEARCWPAVHWSDPDTLLDHDVSIPANQGLLTGAVPKGASNQARFPVEVPAGTQRLTITLVQGNDPNPIKDDVDINLLDRSGKAVWSIGSPYSNETGTLWGDNLDAVFPGAEHDLIVEVESYSGVAYQGHLSVVAERALLS
jgi:hypothetical protein